MTKKLYAVYDPYNGEIEVYRAANMRKLKDFLKKESPDDLFDFRIERISPTEV